MTTGRSTAPQRGASPLVHELMLELEQLPPAQVAALRVVQVVDDGHSGAGAVAKAAAVDAALTARMLRMANSAYYGLSGRVSSASFAVTVLGFTTVRSLAAVAAVGLNCDEELPPGFWARGAAVATAAAALAPRVGADVPDAFCAGVLHDLGTVLLWRHDPAGHAQLLAQASSPTQVQLLELGRYGTTHATVCAEVLQAWSFPRELCAALGHRHDPPSPTATPLLRALQGGVALAAAADGTAGLDDDWVTAALDAAGVQATERPALVEQVRRDGAELSAALSA